jgi:AcrR family transcriptional regulator
LPFSDVEKIFYECPGGLFDEIIMPRKAKYSKNDIIDTAFELARKQGWAGLSVNAVAEQIGCSSMPIYSHFKNMEQLQDAVVIKGWELLKEYEDREYTGDRWVDQAIGYVRFAKKEKELFRCLIDGRNLKLHRRMQQQNWKHLAAQLTDYDGFKGLSDALILRIRYSRYMLSYGIAIAVSMGNSEIISSDKIISGYLTSASHALLIGYPQTPRLDEATEMSLKEYRKKYSKTLKS